MDIWSTLNDTFLDWGSMKAVLPEMLKVGLVNTLILAAASVYVSDFGEFRIVPDRFSRDRTLLGIDPDLWGLAQLRGVTRETLAKTGDADKTMLITEWTLESRNEKGNFKITDINSAL